MSINTKALKDFQKVWEPVIESIPLVLSAVNAKGDLDRQIAAKQAELDEANEKIKAVFDKAEQELDGLKAQADSIRQEQADVIAEITRNKSEARAEADKAKQKVKDSLTAAEAKLEHLKAKVSSVEADWQEKETIAAARHAAKVAGFEAEIADLEKKKASAEKTLDNLRKKLG